MIKRITADVVGIRGENGATFPYCNTYVIADGEEVIVIGPHCGDGRLREGLAALGCSIHDVTLILNTHFHLDHSASSWWLISKYQIPVFMHAKDATAMSSWESMHFRYGVYDAEMKTMLPRVFLEISGFQPFTVSYAFGASCFLLACTRAIHAPKHTTGHCCFLYKDLLFSGDVEFNVPWVGNINSDAHVFSRL